MPIRLPSYLHRNRHGVYGFRVVIPRALRPTFGCSERRLSLYTSDRQQAKRIAYRVAEFVVNYFARIAAMTQDEARELAAQFVADTDAARAKLLEELATLAGAAGEDGARRAAALGDLQAVLDDVASVEAELAALNAACESGASTENIARAEKLGARLSALNEKLGDMAFATIAPMTEHDANLQRGNSILQRAQVVALSEQHCARINEQAAANEAKSALITQIAARTAALTVENIARAPHVVADVVQPPMPPCELLSAVVKAYCESSIAEKRWTAKTEQENKGIFGLWLRIVGDRPISEYRAADHRTYKSALLKLPANVSKMPQYAGKTIAEIVALGDEPAAIGTINKALTRTAAMLSWAKSHGYSDFVPDRGMKVRNPKRADEARAAFTDDDLRAIFHCTRFGSGRNIKPHRYWAPLVALYSGCRVNEIAQLHLADFIEPDAVPSISVNDTGHDTKRVKSSSGRRIVPLHPELLALGLLDYIRTLRRRGETRVFPELKPGRDGYGQQVSRWFARHAKACGVSGRGRTFHSFRHTFATRLANAGAQPERVVALMGHAQAGVTFSTYVKPSPAGQFETVSLLDLRWLSGMLPRFKAVCRG